MAESIGEMKRSGSRGFGRTMGRKYLKFVYFESWKHLLLYINRANIVYRGNSYILSPFNLHVLLLSEILRLILLSFKAGSVLIITHFQQLVRVNDYFDPET